MNRCFIFTKPQVVFIPLLPKQQKTMRRFIVFLGIVFFAFILFIIYSADTKTPNIFISFTRTIPLGDKLGHFFLFGVLTLLLNFAFKLKKITIAKLKIYTGASLVSIFVILEELSQGFLPSRTLSFGDLTADFVGISLFSLLTYLIARKQHANSKVLKTSRQRKMD